MFRRTLTLGEELELVWEALTPFRELGVSVKDVTAASIWDHGYTLDQFKKHASVLPPLHAQSLMPKVLVEAVNANVLTDAHVLTTAQVIGFCNFVRSDKGSEAICSAASALSYVKLFDSMRADKAVEAKRIREECDDKIGKLKAQIAELEDKKERRLRRCDRRYGACSKFVLPDVGRMANEAWGMYISECGLKKVQPRAKTDDNLVQAVTQFAPAVKDKHLHAYLKAEDVRHQLESYADLKIKHFSTLRHKREANTFRALLATASGKVAGKRKTQFNTNGEE